jgi:hypothetical protein
MLTERAAFRSSLKANHARTQQHHTRRLSTNARLKQTRAHTPAKKAHTKKRRREKSNVGATRNSGSSVVQLDVRPQCRPRGGPGRDAELEEFRRALSAHARPKQNTPAHKQRRKADARLKQTHAKRAHTQRAQATKRCVGAVVNSSQPRARNNHAFTRLKQKHAKAN